MKRGREGNDEVEKENSGQKERKRGGRQGMKVVEKEKRRKGSKGVGKK